MSDTFTIFEHFTQPDGRIQTRMITNDDDDDGLPDMETVDVTFDPVAREVALSSPMDYSHVGLYGQPVRVYLDGIERIEPRVDGAPA